MMTDKKKEPAISPDLDKALDEFIADKPKDIETEKPQTRPKTITITEDGW